MPPDVGTLPLLTHPDRVLAHPSSSPSARQTSMLPPLIPASMMAHNSPSHHLRNPSLVADEHGHGLPLRHPRPLTAVELYLECEKEQEAVVNRLTRELTALRAQSASVASNASISSSSTGASQSLLPIDISDPNPTHQMTGPTHPTPSRRHRSSSSISARSTPASTPTSAGPLSGHPFSDSFRGTSASAAITPPAGPMHIASQASMDRMMAASGGSSHDLSGASNSLRSRGPSFSTAGVSETSTPARQSLEILRPATNITTTTYSGRPLSMSRSPSQTMFASTSSAHSIPIVDPHASLRSEMDLVRAENDALRQRVLALERALRANDPSSRRRSRPPRRDSSVSEQAAGAIHSTFSSRPSSGIFTGGGVVAAWDGGGIGGVAGPRERSESQSTTASHSRTRAPLVVPGVSEEDVRVGESAASSVAGGGGVRLS